MIVLLWVASYMPLLTKIRELKSQTKKRLLSRERAQKIWILDLAPLIENTLEPNHWMVKIYLKIFVYFDSKWRKNTHRASKSFRVIRKSTYIATDWTNTLGKILAQEIIMKEEICWEKMAGRLGRDTTSVNRWARTKTSPSNNHRNRKVIRRLDYRRW